MKSVPRAPRKLTDLAEIAQHLPPGSTVVLHSAFAEPQFLGRELARVGKGLRDVRVYNMMPMGELPYAESDLDGHLVNKTFYPGRSVRGAASSGRIEVVRVPLSKIPVLFKEEKIKADVLLLHLSPPNSNGLMSMGLAVDYMPAVLDQDPIVVAEVNPDMPHTFGDSCVQMHQVDYFVDAKAPPMIMKSRPSDSVDGQIARNIADLIGNRAVLQIGIGSIADQVLRHLTHLHDLGIHSGIITDAIVPLINSGVVTNATKHKFTGKSVTTMAGGTQSFYTFLHKNPLFEFHPCAVTHDPELLASIENFCAINTVLQIDLEGKANAEQIDRKIISSIGGLPDFAKGAAAAKNGRSIISLRSCSRDGSTSNVLGQLPSGTPIALTSTHIDYVVTEFGVARISGLGPAERADALINIAHPNHRADLRRAQRQS